jgi:hypothetical protein
MPAPHSRKPSGLTRSIRALFEEDGSLAGLARVGEPVMEEVAEPVVEEVGEVVPGSLVGPAAEVVPEMEKEEVGEAAPGVAAEPAAEEVPETEKDWGTMLEAVAEAEPAAEEVPETEEPDWEPMLEALVTPEADPATEAVVESTVAPEAVPEPATAPEPEPEAVPELAAVPEPEAEEVSESDVRDPRLAGAIATLQQAVEDFLSRSPRERGRMGLAVREAATPLAAAGALNALADAVERLTSESEAPPDEAALETARSLVSPAVASRIAARIGAERDEAQRALLTQVSVRIGPEMALAFSDALSGSTDRFARRAFVDAMVEMGDVAMPVIEDMVDDPRWFVVRNAVSVLGQAGGERAVELLVSTLAHADGRVRREAILALAKVGGEEAGMLTYGMLEDPDPEVRLAATMAAGTLKVDRSLRPLLSLLDEETDHDVVIGALGALGKLGDPGAVPAIEKRTGGTMLSRQPTDIRIAAYRALGAIRTPHAKGLLVRAADDKNSEVRAAVRELLGMR